MARENRDRWTAGGADGDAGRESAPPEAAGGPAPAGRGGAPSVAVPAQRAGHPVTPPAPPVAPPPPPPPAMPLSPSPQSAVPPGDPGATGRSGGSRTQAPAASPAAPRGRDTADLSGHSAAHGDGRDSGHGAGAEPGAGGRVDPAPGPGDGPAADGDGEHTGHLLGDGERDRLGQRLHHALAGFVDSPHDAVAEAAEVLAAAERELITSLRDRRHALREGWRENGDPDDPGPDTEQLRLTLRSYREVMERLLRA
ncbi:hypothetical protein AB0D99_00040 [Streptomyces sp. NPDC047971]|uniref:hypothetical protein n=1 Tax=Streptomyces sp. NPDC047971 TaxID=3154499 RepID=UPI0033F4BABC